MEKTARDNLSLEARSLDPPGGSVTQTIVFRATKKSGVYCVRNFGNSVMFQSKYSLERNKTISSMFQFIHIISMNFSFGNPMVCETLPPGGLIGYRQAYNLLLFYMASSQFLSRDTVPLWLSKSQQESVLKCFFLIVFYSSRDASHAEICYYYTHPEL
jgi:hypothetical protein